MEYCSALQPADDEVGDLSGHIIIAGFGRVGQMVSQLLSERLIQFVALDVRSERVQAGRAMNLPVYFGDAGSAKVTTHTSFFFYGCMALWRRSPACSGSSRSEV
jgi:voltage-gated potassium channel Kch